MKKQKGFSLIELLIVVAIILIIAAIAIPNLLRSRMAANEASAVGSLRTIDTAEMTFTTTYPDVGYANLASLGGAATAHSARISLASSATTRAAPLARTPTILSDRVAPRPWHSPAGTFSGGMKRKAHSLGQEEWAFVF